MSGRDRIAEALNEVFADDDGAQLLRPLIEGAAQGAAAIPAPAPGVIVGELIGIADEGRTPLVAYTGQPGSAALRARSVVDLHGAHIGKALVLMFEKGDLSRPVIMGVLRDGFENSFPDQLVQVEVESGGERAIVSAREQLVLRCGKASITMKKDGHIDIRGESIVTQAVAANRVRGGSVELN